MQEKKVSIAINFAKRLAFIRQILREREIFEHEFAAFLGVTVRQYISLEHDEGTMRDPIRERVSKILFSTYQLTFEEMTAECIEYETKDGENIELWKEPLRRKVDVICTVLDDFLIKYRSYEK